MKKKNRTINFQGNVNLWNRGVCMKKIILVFEKVLKFTKFSREVSFPPTVKEIFRKNILVIVKAKQSFRPFFKQAQEIYFFFFFHKVLAFQSVDNDVVNIVLRIGSTVHV